MNKKDLLYTFINTIERKQLLTNFIKNIFDYKEFHDYNYLFRMTENSNQIIIDIYDNISDNRFNRYIFNFSRSNYDIRAIKEGNVFVTYINVLRIGESDNKLYKLAYLTKLNKNKMIEYANTFLDKEFVDILMDIIKNKSIS